MFVGHSGEIHLKQARLGCHAFAVTRPEFEQELQPGGIESPDFADLDAE